MSVSPAHLPKSNSPGLDIKDPTREKTIGGMERQVTAWKEDLQGNYEFLGTLGQRIFSKAMKSN